MRSPRPILPHFKVFFLLLLLSLHFLPEGSAQIKENTSSKGYGEASYTASDKGAYMQSWLLLGPLPVKEGDSEPVPEEIQEEAFESDVLTQVAVSPEKALPNTKFNGKSLSWQAYTSPAAIIDLDAVYKHIDYAAGYALAEILADSSYTALLALGSDDGIKVWHNGQLIHKVWMGRGVTMDEDLVSINLVKGSNQLLLKVQDMSQGWGFSARMLDKAALTEQLLSAAGKGWMEQLTLLKKFGADVNATNAAGLTALHMAQISGREAVEEMLLEMGAKATPMPSGEAIMDSYYGELNEKEAAGVAILVAKEGEVLYRKGFGYQDIGNKVLVSPETKFRIGSVTKQFTAAAILKLQEEGLLSVDDKLAKFLPDFPRADEVSLHHLLTHTSGIHSYTSKPDFMDKVESPVTPEELINYFKNDTYDFSPGEEFRYNNSGYFLLGYIIEKVSGQSYGDFLKEKFFKPLGMDNTGLYVNGMELENEALGYGLSGNTYEPAINWDMSWAGGAGALFSTVDDLLKWNKALFAGKVLNENSLQAALTPVKLANGESPQGGDYGYGLLIGEFRGRKVIHHGGGLHGFMSHLALFPKEDLTIVLFTNVTPPQVEFEYSKLAEIYLWESLEKQKSFEAAEYSAAALKKFEGRYDFGRGAVMIITTEGDKIFAQLTGQPRFQIFPAANNAFFWKVVDAKIHFIEDEEGNFNEAMFYQAGNEIKIKRMEEVATVEVDPAIYDGYVGKYDVGNNIFISISKENNRIFAQGTNQPKFEIFPVSPHEFVLKEVNARITFVKNGQGSTEKLILNMQGQDTNALKVE